MADNVAVTPGTGKTIATDEVTDGTLGTVQVQFTKLMDGTLDSTNKAIVDSSGRLSVLARMTDGTTPVTVKPASTAPLATDPSLVVSISPNGVNTNGGKTSANSAPSVLATDEATLSVAFDTTQLMNGVSGVGLTPTKVKIATTTATTTTLVALVASKKIRIVALYLVTSAACTITLQSHTTTSNSDGGLAHAANSGIVLPFNPIGWFDTTAGEALDMVTSATANVSGQLTYVAV